MKIIFSHGKESGPWGRKIIHLAQAAMAQGCHVESIDYRGIESPEARAELLTEKLSECPDPCALVGSSMGAYVSLVASQSVPVRGLFLLAPAVGLAGYAQHSFNLTGVSVKAIHGWQDTVVPVENVISFSREHRASLHLVDSDHNLSHVLVEINYAFNFFLESLNS